MRLIDADALSKSVLEWLPSDPCGRPELEHPFETDICISMLQEIEEAPAIDAVSVVRCEDCIFYEKILMNGTIANFSIQGFCHHYESVVYRNDFCSYGERRVSNE